jgi:hypothetical protein
MASAMNDWIDSGDMKRGLQRNSRRPSPIGVRGASASLSKG